MARRTLVLFDVDGTLTEPREAASSEMTSFLAKLKGTVTVGIVGGSDLVKQQEQMGHNIVNEVDYSFSENGLVAFKDGKEIGRQVGGGIAAMLEDGHEDIGLRSRNQGYPARVNQAGSGQRADHFRSANRRMSGRRGCESRVVLEVDPRRVD
jgi:hydroxymethylpyrimidine pyrophosphatase-like HAD family hydrolase